MASDSPARSLDEIDLSALRKCWWCVSETGEGFLRALFHSRTGWHVTDFSGKAAVTPLDGKVWNVKPGFVRMRVETENVSQDGCLDLCNGNGRCTLGQNSWQCVCQTGWRGPGCNVAMETSCAYNKDNEGDVKSWLVMFGFQLSNIIPGFPRAKMYFVPPPYELSESQASENGQLITGVQQTTERHNQAFLALEGQVISKKLHANIREKAGHWFATTTPIIGKGIMFAIKEGRVTTGVSSIASEDSRKVASVLNNAYYLDKMHYSIEGKDTHYFVKIGSADSDLVTLGTTIGRKVLESGVNMTVSQPTLLVNGRTRRFTNIEFQYSTLLLSIRYGLTPDTLDEEKARVLDQARQRALGMAWAKEQQKARDGREGSRLWTEGEKQQLLGTGRVQGYEGYYVLPVEQYPELADSSSNIQFLRQNEMGKR